MNAEICGNVEDLIMVHDVARWQAFPVVQEVGGFRIVNVI